MGSTMGSSGFQHAPYFRNLTCSLRLLSFPDWVPEWVPVGSSICESRKCVFCLRLPHKTQESRDGFQWVPIFVQAGSDSLLASFLIKHRKPVSHNICFALPRRSVPQVLFSRFTMAASMSFEPDAAGTKTEELPQWGSAEVVAFHVVLPVFGNNEYEGSVATCPYQLLGVVSARICLQAWARNCLVVEGSTSCFMESRNCHGSSSSSS